MLRYTIFILLLCGLDFYSQTDTTKLQKLRTKIVLNNDTNLVLGGTRIVSKLDSTDYHKVEISGYVSTYYGHYSDDTEINGFVQFPTMAARNKQFGLNVAQIGMKYQDATFRGNITLHYGDIAESNWPKPFTLIQEANAGLKIIKNLWLDAGFFKTHIGLESIQPRENITSSMSVITYYEPYFFSGAKLTYQVSSKLSLQANIFNGYNEYIEDNSNKALGFSALYEPTSKFSFTYNFLTCDETPDNIKTKHQRYYHNLYGTYRSKKWQAGVELNYGSQQNTLLTDTTKQASMVSGLIVGKYSFMKKLAGYGRAEYFSDKNQILTGNTSIGDYLYGFTGGLEYQPYSTVSLSIEYRGVESDHLIFKEGNTLTNQRHEYIICLDIWF